jgi:Domain of unknown function (DUF4291)
VRHLRLKPTLDQQAAWPADGKFILAQYDAQALVVYQAYEPRIGRDAAQHGRFGDGFKLDRMSWIKPGFLWMMHRSQWGSARGQEVVLAVWIKRDAFDAALSRAVASDYDPQAQTTKEDWQRVLAGSEVRLQWDPDYDPRGIRVKRRVIQLGLAGDTLRRFAQEWIIEIQDISDYVREQARYQREVDMLLTPAEKVYPLADPELARQLGVSPELPPRARVSPRRR